MRSLRAVVVTALLVSSSSIAAAAAVPTSAAAAAVRTVEVDCPDIGTLPVALGVDVPPAAAQPLPTGLTLQLAYRGRDRRTGAGVRGGTTGTVACGEIPVAAVRFRGLTAAGLPAGVSPTDLFDGAVVVSVTVTAAADLAAAPTTTPAPSANLAAAPPTPFLDAAAIRTYLGARSGHVSLAVYEATTGITHSYDGSRHYVSASIVKVAILGTLLRRAQDAGRSLTSSERALAVRMIERSDNAAASSLWRAVGGRSGVQAFLTKAGLTSTTAGPGGYWGLTTTTAPDQVRLMRTVAYPNAVLSNAGRAYLDTLMRAVVTSQRWGVTGGLPSGAVVAVKNGWLPRSTGWVINSIGHVRHGNRDYVIAALSSSDPGMGYGITTVEHLSGIVWGAVNGVRLDDVNRDRVGDVFVRVGATLKVYLGNGGGWFHGTRTLGSGWAGYTALVTPGDVTGDGNADLLMRDASGVLYLAPGTGVGTLGTRRRIGAGWNGYTLAPAGNLTASGRPDLLARDGSGVLWLYPITGNGVVGARIRLGSGWGGYPVFTGAGDLTGDGRADLLAVDGNGRLWLFPGGVDGGLLPRRLLPGSWAGVTALVAPGNWDRAGGNDLLVRDTAGALWFYPGNDNGGFGARRSLGTGWAGMSFIG
jgi:beta-lactamase class A